MIAIEMCHILRTKTEIDVLGRVLLDTHNGQQWDPSDPDAVDYKLSISTWVSQRVQASVTRRSQDVIDRRQGFMASAVMLQDNGEPLSRKPFVLR